MREGVEKNDFFVTIFFSFVLQAKFKHVCVFIDEKC